MDPPSEIRHPFDLDVARPSRPSSTWILVWAVVLGVVALLIAVVGGPRLAVGAAAGAAIALGGALAAWTAVVPGALAAALAIGLTRPTAAEALAAGAILVVVALAATGLGSAVRATIRWADRSARRARLLTTAATALDRCETRDQLFAELPAMIERELADVRATIDATATAGEPSPAAPPSDEPSSAAEEAHRVALAIDGGDATVLLVAERRDGAAFQTDDRATLGALRRMSEDALARIGRVDDLRRERREESSVARLTHRLLTAADRSTVADVALEALLERSDIDAGIAFVLGDGAYRLLARRGPLPNDPSLEHGLPIGHGHLDRAWREKTISLRSRGDGPPDPAAPAWERDARALAFVPIVNSHQEVEATLALASYRSAVRWSDDDRAHLDQIANTIGVALERAVLQEQFAELLTVVRKLAQFDERIDDPTLLYRRVAEAALRVVPGAEGASILRRVDGGFAFVASPGYDPGLLGRLPPSTVDETLAWYGRDERDFRAGVPRLLTGAEIQVRSFEAMSDQLRDRMENDDAVPDPEAFRRSGRLDELRANICVPIAHQGEVTGLLNLDNLTREDGFGHNAVQIAFAFAQQIAVIFRQAEYRESLERLAITDTLTGLGNREGFDRSMQRELERASRYRRELSLVMMDLDGFKAINDRHGHQVGDEVLARVATALEGERRENDLLFRWGGDEFVLLLPETTRAEAEVAADRYEQALRGLVVRGMSIGASRGIATYPGDGSTSDALLGAADTRLYDAKDRSV